MEGYSHMTCAYASLHFLLYHLNFSQTIYLKFWNSRGLCKIHDMIMSHWPITSVSILTFTASPVIYEKKILVLMHHIDRANNDWKGQTKAFFMQKIFKWSIFSLAPLFKSTLQKTFWILQSFVKYQGFSKVLFEHLKNIFKKRS